MYFLRWNHQNQDENGQLWMKTYSIIHVWLHHSNDERQKKRKEKKKHKHMMEPHNLMKGMMSNHDQQTRPWGFDISRIIGVGPIVQEFVGSHKMLEFSITSSYFMVSTLSRTLIEFTLQCELIDKLCMD